MISTPVQLKKSRPTSQHPQNCLETPKLNLKFKNNIKLKKTKNTTLSKTLFVSCTIWQAYANSHALRPETCRTCQIYLLSFANCFENNLSLYGSYEFRHNSKFIRHKKACPTSQHPQNCLETPKFNFKITKMQKHKSEKARVGRQKRLPSFVT